VAAADLRGTPGATRIAIAVGSEALQKLVSIKADVPVLPTMTLRSDSERIMAMQPRSTNFPAGAYLNVPISSLLPELKRLFPGKTRLAVLGNPAEYLRDDSSLAARMKQQGFTAEMVQCTRPEDLIPVFVSLKGKVDLVLVLPDASLFNAATVKPLVLASLENRLPIVAYSLNFVRAGAAVGMYLDFREVGYQTAEIAQKYLTGQISSADEKPRKISTAINQRVLRLLGLEPHLSTDDPVVVIR